MSKINLNQLIYNLFLKIMTPVYVVVLCFVYIPLLFLLFKSHQQLCTVIGVEAGRNAAPLSRELFLGDKEIANGILVGFESFLDKNFVKSEFKFQEVNSDFKGEKGFVCEASIISVRFSQVFSFTNQKLGMISGEVSQFSFWWFIAIMAGIGLVITISFHLLRRGISYELNRNVFSPLRSILDGETSLDKEKLITEEVVDLLQTFEESQKRLLEIEKEKILEEENQKMIKLAKQISHDIRSPLEALRSITSELESLDSISKSIVSNSVGRINEITNGLLKPSLNSTSLQEVINLQILIEELILEKNFEKKIQIQFESKLSYENTFVLGNSVELYRAFSNIINNAHDAYDDNVLPIFLKLFLEGGEVVLCISDTASGMSQEVLDKALIGGFSSKVDGNGLGLSYAKTIIEKHHGSFNIQSFPNKGTSIFMGLRPVSSPKWFLGKIELVGNRIICIDDDESFLNLYQQKFIQYKEKVIVGNDQVFLNLELHDGDQVFIDYDLGKQNGIELVSIKNWYKNVTLVTSFYNESSIQEACLKLGIKILPKQIFNKVSISKKAMASGKSIKQMVLIDDDPLIRMMWENEAKKRSIDITSYSNVDDFLVDLKRFHQDCAVVIDSDLGDDIKGEVEAQRISDLGFKNITLATGYSPEDIKETRWIRNIIGKRPNFTDIFIS